MADTFDIGDVVTIWGVFRDAAGTQAATTASLAFLRPGATSSEGAYVTAAQAADETIAETDMGITLSGVTGLYRADIIIDTAGTWWYRWQGVGAVAQRETGWFQVRRERVSAPPGTLVAATAAATAAFAGTSVGP
jgi:hypothetical protein